ncbi:cupin domain-containing protein [Kribbella sp. NPDC023855]|uniref:cupin domain-containing protein n=1 Tax=Kribbella sp. NPDC023855 TaxID=3154698 RepID=UPI0033F00E73
MSGREAIVRNAGEGDLRWFAGGGVHRWLATAEETGGSYLLFEDVMERGKVTPLHTHPEVEETMIVMEGEILMHLDGTERKVGAGGMGMVPRGLPHAFLVTSETARILCLITPGVGQDFFFGASEPYVEGADHQVDFSRIEQSGRDNGGIEILGPPPFAHLAAARS